ncbi:MAG: Asp/Glu/hydantoin racemase [Rhizobacter sp.]
MSHDIAFLHTSPAHVVTFGALMQTLAPDLRVSHSVREDLLADAQKEGIDSTPLIARVREALAEVAATGAAVVVCTCSTLGAIAESTDTGGAFHSSRIDRAMADEAVRHGPKVLLVAALQSTLAPTAALLQSSADRLGTSIELDSLVVEGAWSHFQAGRHGDYIDAIAAAVARAAVRADIIVLAQASMAPAADLLGQRGVIALTSPRLGVQHAIMLCRQAGGVALR